MNAYSKTFTLYAQHLQVLLFLYILNLIHTIFLPMWPTLKITNITIFLFVFMFGNVFLTCTNYKRTVIAKYIKLSVAHSKLPFFNLSLKNTVIPRGSMN